jgi:hypothetical protein
MQCEHLEEDGSCGEPNYASCIAWVDWDHTKRDGEDDEYFCKLDKEERDKFGG